MFLGVFRIDERTLLSLKMFQLPNLHISGTGDVIANFMFQSLILTNSMFHL